MNLNMTEIFRLASHIKNAANGAKMVKESAPFILGSLSDPEMRKNIINFLVRLGIHVGRKKFIAFLQETIDKINQVKDQVSEE